MTKVYTIDPLRMGYMSTFGTLIAFLRLLLPFLKESVLQNATFKEWLKDNLVSVIWILLMMGMLCVVVYLFDTVGNLRHANEELSHKLEMAQLQNTELQKRYDMLNGEYTDEKTHNADLEKQAAKLTEENQIATSKVHLYENWLQHWDVDINYHGTGYPPIHVMTAIPPTKRRKAPEQSNTPAVDNKDPNRNIFQRIRDWGKDHL